MGYNIAFSGLSSTAEAIDVTSNNIANAQTVGYKAGEYVFADQFFRAQDPQSHDRAGMGAFKETIRRNQNYGSITSSQNPLDMALTGPGLFTLAKNVAGTVPIETPSVFQYTRNGQFGVDSQSRIVNENGMFLVGFPADANGNISQASKTVLTLDQNPLPASQSTTSTIALNLDNTKLPVSAGFDPLNNATYSQATAQTVYDAAGNQHTLSMYYRKVEPATMYFYPTTQGATSSFQYNTKQDTKGLNSNGFDPSVFNDAINTDAASIETTVGQLNAGIGALNSATNLATTAIPNTGTAPVETLSGTTLNLDPPSQTNKGDGSTWLMTLNDGTQLLVTKQVSSTPGSLKERFAYQADRYETYATIDGINVNSSTGVTSSSQIQVGYNPGSNISLLAPQVKQTTAPDVATNEVDSVTFSPMSAGDVITLGNLTFTASGPMTAAQVAASFKAITNTTNADVNSLNTALSAQGLSGTFSGSFLADYTVGPGSSLSSGNVEIIASTPSSSLGITGDNPAISATPEGATRVSKLQIPTGTPIGTYTISKNGTDGTLYLNGPGISNGPLPATSGALADQTSPQVVTFGNGISITLTADGLNPTDSGQNIVNNFDGKTFTVGTGGPIGTMAFVGGKNIDSLSRDPFGAPSFKTQMSFSTLAGANPISITVDSTEMTAYSASAQTYTNTTNGNPLSQLTSYTVDNAGKIVASYDNGTTRIKGQVCIANFNNTEGLIPVGGNAYEQSGTTGTQSGLVMYGTANSGNLGAIRAKALESSNVDLTAELVKLMTLQRQYTAASQAVKVEAATLVDDAIRIGQ